MYNLDLRPLVWFGFIVMALIWGLWELVDWLWIDEVIRSSKPIIPEIELVIKNNQVDTLYIYRKP